MLARQYLEHAVELLEQLRATQLEKIEQAADMIAQAVVDGHTLYAWGGPHSSLPVQDLFERAGGLAILNAIIAPGLSYEYGPIRMGTWLERVEGYGKEFFARIGAEAGDVIILVSTSGRNAFPVEMAMSARQAGLRVIGVTSLAYTQAVEARHSSGTKMYQHCDVLLDNLAAPGDASLSHASLPQKVGPTSGWMGTLILQALMAEVAFRLAARGIEPPIRYAANAPTAQEEYRRRVLQMIERHATKFGGMRSPVLLDQEGD
jgi:uncharacterized phosphosugar-binding protein